VYLYIDGVPSYPMPIDDTGHWQVTVYGLSIGTHTLCAAVKDLNHQVEAQDCITYTVQIDPAWLTISDPEEGSTSGPDLVVGGLCHEATTVRLSMDGLAPTEQPCVAVAYQQEYFGLADGAHTITVTMLYNAAPVVTRERSFTVDATAPAPPVITSPSTKTTITEATLPLTGTAEPGSTVEIRTADEAVAWTTSAADDGSWSLTLDWTFFDYSGVLTGHREQMTVKAAAVDAYGNRSATSSYIYTVHIR
jgi:large repetitive protein